MKKLKKKKLYRIRFIDHAIGDDTVICEVCGWYLKSTKTSHVFSWWLVDTDSEATFESNLEPFSLVKGAILEIESI